MTYRATDGLSCTTERQFQESRSQYNGEISGRVLDDDPERDHYGLDSVPDWIRINK